MRASSLPVSVAELAKVRIDAAWVVVNLIESRVHFEAKTLHLSTKVFYIVAVEENAGKVGNRRNSDDYTSNVESPSLLALRLVSGPLDLA